MKILVTGKNGQLGSEIQDISKLYTEFEFVFVDRNQLDLSNVESIQNVLSKYQPNIIINAAAYTAVDKAETEVELVDKINHLAVHEIASWCKNNQAKLVHVSTDYVFSGDINKPLKESDVTSPINEYGNTKLLGEKAIEKSGCDYVIVRTSWVYSTYGANFVKTMLRLMTERTQISVVADQHGSPTYAKDLANAILKIVEKDNWFSGIYNFSNEGEITWYQFAEAIKEIADLDCDITPITSAEYPTPAKRPFFSFLDKTKIKQTYNVSVPHWKDSLKNMFNNMNNQ